MQTAKNWCDGERVKKLGILSVSKQGPSIQWLDERPETKRQLVLGDALAASPSLPGALSSSNPKPRSRQRRFLKGNTASVWYRWQSGWYGANVNKQSQRAVFPHTKNTRTRMSYTWMKKIVGRHTVASALLLKDLNAKGRDSGQTPCSVAQVPQWARPSLLRGPLPWSLNPTFAFTPKYCTSIRPPFDQFHRSLALSFSLSLLWNLDCPSLLWVHHPCRNQSTKKLVDRTRREYLTTQ